MSEKCEFYQGTMKLERTIDLQILCRWQGRIKASAGQGAVPNAGPLQTYNKALIDIRLHPSNATLLVAIWPIMAKCDVIHKTGST